MLGFSYGARVVLLVGPGDNGGDALYAGAELSRRGVAVAAVLADPARAHAGGLAALRGRRRPAGRAGRRRPGRPGRGRPARHRRPRAGARGAGAAGALECRAARRRCWPSTSPSGVDPDTGAVAGPAVRAADHRLHGRAEGRPAGRPGPAAHRPAAAGRPGPRPAAARAASCTGWSAATCGCRPRGRPTTSTPAAWSGWRPARRPIPARPSCASARPGSAGSGRCATPATRRPRWSGAGPR